jgi:hypothetical protein
LHKSKFLFKKSVILSEDEPSIFLSDKFAESESKDPAARATQHPTKEKLSPRMATLAVFLSLA